MSSSHHNVSRHLYGPRKIDHSKLDPKEVDVPFEWGHNGLLWKINENNEKEIMHLEKYGINTIYSDDTFHSSTFKKITFKLNIKKRYTNMYIGIINNVQHKNTRFWTKEIPNNNEMKIKQNMYYCIGAHNGKKSSHVTNHEDKACMNDSINSGDILTFTINFESKSISIVQNNGKTSTLFKNIEDICKNTNWRFFVSSYMEDSCVELLSCTGFVNYESGTKRRLEDTVSKQYFSFWFINTCIKNKNTDELFQNKSKVSYHVVTVFLLRVVKWFF